MKPKHFLHTILTASLTSAWWAFAMWPKAGYTGEGPGPIIILPILLTIIAVLRFVAWCIDEWDD